MKLLHSALAALLIPLSTVAAPAPSVATFLAPYVNPAQSEVPEDGLYPFGQKMWFSFYSTPGSRSMIDRLVEAGMTLTGPHYSGSSGPKDLEEAYRAGLKAYWRLRLPGKNNWGTVSKLMKTKEGRAWLTDQIKGHLKTVQRDRTKNRAVVAWYAHPEEPIHRDGRSYSIEEQRAYLRLVRDLIAANDKKKRPFFVSERGDSPADNIMANTKYVSGVMKQNYLMCVNAYDYDGNEMNERFLVGQWAKDELRAARAHDKKGLSYTGRIRPVITTLSSYIDPEDPSLRNEAWLRSAITHDFYLSIALGVHGVNVYSWAHGGETGALQRRLYLEVIGKFSNAGLGQVFLWGDERKDIDLKITDGPRKFEWNLYRTTYKEPSITFRNIQHGDNRYILLVNSAKEAVRVRLKGVPRGLQLHDIVSKRKLTVGASIVTSIPSLGVRMGCISEAAKAR